jgi:hypothetical protein
MWEPRRLSTLWASMACNRDSFTFLHLYLFIYIYFAMKENLLFWKRSSTFLQNISRILRNYTALRPCNNIAYIHRLGNLGSHTPAVLLRMLESVRTVYLKVPLVVMFLNVEDFYFHPVYNGIWNTIWMWKEYSYYICYCHLFLCSFLDTQHL